MKSWLVNRILVEWPIIPMELGLKISYTNYISLELPYVHLYKICNIQYVHLEKNIYIYIYIFLIRKNWKEIKKKYPGCGHWHSLSLPHYHFHSIPNIREPQHPPQVGPRGSREKPAEHPGLSHGGFLNCHVLNYANKHGPMDLPKKNLIKMRDEQMRDCIKHVVATCLSPLAMLAASFRMFQGQTHVLLMVQKPCTSLAWKNTFQELTYPTLGRGKSSTQKCRLGWDI